MVDGVTVAMSVMAAALPVIFSPGLGEGRLECRRWHHGDDGTRFGGKCRGPAAGGPAARPVLRRGAGAVGLGAAPGGGDVRRCGGVLPAAGQVPGCGRTHVLLPADLWSRRRYGAAVIRRC